MSIYRTTWAERGDVIDALCLQEAGASQFIGGRLVFASEGEEDRRVSELTSRGFTICDAGQCEVVAGRIVTINRESVRHLIDELRTLAADWGTHLQSVEMGTPETGEATILAGEAGYEPWWGAR